MDPTIPYIACVLGAGALYLLVRPGRPTVKIIAGLIGLMVFIWLAVSAAGRIEARGAWPEPFFLIFSVIAISAAVRMITHTRPVYSALYFVLVVFASAGMFLMLEAEFMAFALIIVYAGAILITYMFVLMLAQQASRADGVVEQAGYDVNPREPAAAVVVGFIMLALFTNMIFGTDGSMVMELQASRTPAEASVEAWNELDAMSLRRDSVIEPYLDGGKVVIGADGSTIVHARPDGTAHITVSQSMGRLVEDIELPESAQPVNVERVGWALIWKFPVSLEVAGVILLLAMFGAVVLARRQIELGEADLHAAAGMTHYSTSDALHAGGDEA
ncbi:MAG: NADH-quinone oxidoreductase subunit J [Phycisphaerales bacterium]|nr:NADH-quinone oxidoreductase subunit J [Phycisphaerales bacterium]